MSALLEQVDRALGAVGHRPACLLHLVRWHHAGAKHRSVAFVVLAEQLGDEVVAAAMALAARRVDLQFHRVTFASGSVRGARAITRRARSAVHSWSSTACRSGGTSALPIASSKQKWARAFGESAESISPSCWARSINSASQSARSPM